MRRVLFSFCNSLVLICCNQKFLLLLLFPMTNRLFVLGRMVSRGNWMRAALASVLGECQVVP